MAAITPVFHDSYSGQLINNVTNYAVGDTFKKYVESVEVAYDGINDKHLTGFTDTKYLLNPVDAAYTTGNISITLVGDLPSWLMLQLVQLAKGCNGGGMTLLFNDDWITDKDYYCKWQNAGDFVENSELLCGGSMLLSFYRVV